MQNYLTNPHIFSQDKKNALPENIPHFIGVDEAGRGALAGPVVAGAVLLPENIHISGLTDSKKLTPPRRMHLAEEIRQKALFWGLGFVWQNDIDKFNILEATFMAMSRAVSILYFLKGKKNVASGPSLAWHYPALQGVLIDGLHTIPKVYLALTTPSAVSGKNYSNGKEQEAFCELRQKAIVKGDERVLSIAAASILAKTGRDRFMLAAGRRWPGYGFLQHKGYGTKEHLAALKNLGPCRLHRLSFAPCRAMEQKTLFL